MEDSAYSTAVTPVVEYFKDHPLLHQGSPMLYQAYNELDHSRLPDVIESITGPEDMFCEELARSARVNTHITKEQEHNADVMLGLVYMMVGGVDEAHDLVLPYSWPCETIWGGPPVLDSPALGNATHCHALVHRMEGEHPGELGMMGWDNAHFWFSRVPSKHELCHKFSVACQNLEQEHEFSSRDKEFCDKVNGKKPWNWTSITNLCSKSDQSSEITAFCNRIHNLEIKMLFDHCNSSVNGS